MALKLCLLLDKRGYAKFVSLYIVHVKWSDRLKMTIRNLATLLYTELVNLNIFPLRNFGSKTDQITAERLGRWSTRLHFVLLIIGLFILAIFTIVQPQPLTKTFDKPDLNFYNHLIEKYGNELKCSCSLIASTHNKFVTIEPVLHQVRKDYSNLPRVDVSQSVNGVG